MNDSDKDLIVIFPNTPSVRMNQLKKALTQLQIPPKQGYPDNHPNILQIPPKAQVFYLTSEQLRTKASKDKIEQQIIQFMNRDKINSPVGAIIFEGFARLGSHNQNFLYDIYLKHFDPLRAEFQGFIPSRNAEDTALILRSIARREQYEDNPPLLTRVTGKRVYLYQAQEALVEGLLLCGPKKAKLLLKEFDSPQAIFEAILYNPESISKIKGFSTQFITQNQKMLRERFNI